MPWGHLVGHGAVSVPVNSSAHTPLLWCPFSSDRHFRVWISQIWTAGSLPTCTHRQPIRIPLGQSDSALIGRAYLCRGHVVLEWVDGETEDVVVVAEIKPLTVLQPVVDDGDGRHVVHHLPRLSVEQVVTTVEAPVPAANRKQTRHNKTKSRRSF